MKQNKLSDILPSIPEVIFAILIAVLISIFGNSRLIVKSIVETESSAGSVDSLASDVFAPLKSILSFLDGFSVAPTLVTFMFWGFIGILAYSVIRVLGDVGSEVKEDVDISTHYMHPKHYVKTKVFVGALIYSLRNSIFYLFIVLVVVATARYLGPLSITGFKDLVLKPGWTTAGVYVGAITLLAVAVVVFVVFSRRMFDK